MDFDVALAEFAKHETWRHAREASDEPDWFVHMLMLVMEMV